jgi:hypothetical protein
MAGDWIKVDAVLPEKPEVWLLAEKLDLDPDAVVGKLVRLWAWFDQHMSSGQAISVTPKQIDAVCRCVQFSTALADVGWLVIHKRSGTVSLPNWDRHNGKTAKDRALTRDRMKRSRDAASVTTASPVRHQRREEKRKEKEKKVPRQMPVPADRRDGGTRLGAVPPTPSAGESAPPPPTRPPGRRPPGLTSLSAMLRHVHPPDPDTEAVRAALEAKTPIPIPTDEAEHVQAAQA